MYSILKFITFLKKLFNPFNNNIKVITHSNQQYLQWQGGSIISQLSLFRELSVSRSEYNFDNKRFF